MAGRGQAKHTRISEGETMDHDMTDIREACTTIAGLVSEWPADGLPRMAKAVRTLAAQWALLASGPATLLTAQECQVDTRVRVHPRAQVPRAIGHATAFCFPFTVPGTVVTVYPEGSGLLVRIDPDLYSPSGPAPWSPKQLVFPENGEIHAPTCTCQACGEGTPAWV